MNNNLIIEINGIRHKLVFGKIRCCDCSINIFCRKMKFYPCDMYNKESHFEFEL